MHQYSTLLPKKSGKNFWDNVKKTQEKINFIVHLNKGSHMKNKD